jgi:predicted dehydrogenase
LLVDPDVEAVYIATPHPFHCEWAIKAAEAGKHVLCEKPMGMNHAETVKMFDAARENRVCMMEAFMYRCHPQVARLLEIIHSGRIGEVRTIQASFGFRAGPDPTTRILCNALGGGGILDVGCYTVSLARLVAGAACGEPFADPVKVQASGHVGPTGVDEYAAAVLTFPGDIIAEVACGIRLRMENVVRIYGADGWILVRRPWASSHDKNGTGQISIHAREREDIEIPIERSCFASEADELATAVFEGRPEARPPAMTWADTLGNMQTLDAWRAAVGVRYDADSGE